MIYLGIDPGAKGAIAIIDNEGYSVVDNPINTKEIYEILKKEKDYSDNILPGSSGIFCIIEKSQVLPKQGIVGAFSYGRQYERLITCLNILEIPFQEVSPNKWKSQYTLINKTKKDSIKAAQQLFPKAILHGPKGGIKDGRAEALLLADYGRRIYDRSK